MFHDTEECPKFEKKKLALGSKNDMRNLVNFNVTSTKSESLMCYFSQQHIKFQLKKYRRIISHDTGKDPHFKERLTFCLKNGMRNMVNFNPNSGKS